MKKLELIKAVAAAAETTQKNVEEILDAYAVVVLDAIKADMDDSIPLPGLGYFKTKEVKAKSGTIRFGENQGGTWHTPAHNELQFKVTSSVKEL